MAIPKQVEEQGKKADEMLNQMSAPAVDPSKEVPTADPEKTEAGKETEPKPKEAEEQPKPDDQDLIGKSADAINQLNHRLNVVQGMLNTRNAEYRDLERALNADIVQRDSQIKELKAKVNALEQQLREAGPESKIDINAILSEDDVRTLEDEGLGPNATSIIAKLARAVAKPAADKKVEPAPEPQKKTEPKVQQDDAQDPNQVLGASFFSTLAEQVPNWEQINSTNLWLQWVIQQIPGKKYTRQDQINAAQAVYNPWPIINLLKEFVQTAGATPKKSKMEDAAEDIKPGSSTSQSGLPKDDKIWSRKEIQSFYSHAAAEGMEWKKPDEYQRTDQAIQKAYAAGRVR